MAGLVAFAVGHRFPPVLAPPWSPGEFAANNVLWHSGAVTRVGAVNQPKGGGDKLRPTISNEAEAEGADAHVVRPGVVRVAVHQSAPDSTSDDWPDSAPDLTYSFPLHPLRAVLMLVVGKNVVDLDPEGRRVQIFRQDWRAEGSHRA
jgi:hypothetical protein